MIPRAAIQLMLGHVAHSRWLRFWTRASLHLPRIFPPIYKAHPSPHSSISTLLILERESSLPLLSSTCPWLPLARPWLPSACWLTNVVTFKAVLSPKADSPVSYFSFFLCIFALVEQFFSEDINLGT